MIRGGLEEVSRDPGSRIYIPNDPHAHQSELSEPARPGVTPGESVGILLIGADDHQNALRQPRNVAFLFSRKRNVPRRDRAKAAWIHMLDKNHIKIIFVAESGRLVE